MNIGQTGAQGLQDPAWPDLKLADTDVGHLLLRSRVHWGFFMKQWFEFGPRSYDPAQDVKPASFYATLAARAIKAFEKDGESWFGKKRDLS